MLFLLVPFTHNNFREGVLDVGGLGRGYGEGGGSEWGRARWGGVDGGTPHQESDMALDGGLLGPETVASNMVQSTGPAVEPEAQSWNTPGRASDAGLFVASSEDYLHPPGWHNTGRDGLA
jgi:hypothetical protein